MNYQLQQHKLILLTAKAYAMISGHQQILLVVNQVNEDRLQFKFDRLQECHILLAGAKALYTAWCNSGLAICMQCCGGHGFSHFSGIPAIMQMTLPNSIVEGDISILLLQVGRYLLKCIDNLNMKSDIKVVDHAEYLKDYKRLEKIEIPADRAFFYELDNLVLVFRRCAYILSKNAANSIPKGSKTDDLNNMLNKKSAIKICDAARIHTIATTFGYFAIQTQATENTKVKSLLNNLALVFAFGQIFEHATLFACTETINSEALGIMKDLYKTLLNVLQPEALILVEAFIPDDFVLYSAISDSNEKPYENLFNLIKKVSSMNQVDLSEFYIDTIRHASLKTYPFL